MVGLAALGWHTIWALVLALNDGLCRQAPFCLAVPFEPDIYAAALAYGVTSGPAVSGSEVAAILLTCSGLTVAAFALTSAAARTERVSAVLRLPLYGLYTGLVEEAAQAAATSPTSYVTAFVITDTERDGASLGYFGILENLQVGPDKQVAGVALMEVGTFLLQISDTVRRTPDLRDAPIARILISGSRIRNIAFAVVR